MRVIVLGLLGALLLSGCVTQTIREAKDLSTSGITYADAVDKLLDVTTDEVIDFDSRELIKSQVSSNPKQALLDRDTAMLDLLDQIALLRGQTKLLKSYFVNLQALADSTVKDDAGKAVESLSDSVSKLNKVLGGKNGKESLTGDQKTQIGNLAGLVAGAIQAEKIKRALVRDAQIIGTSLAYHENQLRNITDILKDRYTQDNDLFRNERELGPYADTKNRVGSAWADDRKQWLKTHFFVTELDAATEAAKHLRSVWEEILQGKTDIGTIGTLLSDLNEVVVALDGYKAATAAKANQN